MNPLSISAPAAISRKMAQMLGSLTLMILFCPLSLTTREMVLGKLFQLYIRFYYSFALSLIPTIVFNRGKKLNLTSLEEWMSKGKAPALQHSLKLFNELKSRGVRIILVSSRVEHLRSATVDNLVNEGFFGWNSLLLRFG